MMSSWTFLSVSLVFLLTSPSLLTHADDIDPIIDCRLREYVYQYAITRVNDISRLHYHGNNIETTGLVYGHQSIYDALHADTTCHIPPITSKTFYKKPIADVTIDTIQSLIQLMKDDVRARGWNVESIYVCSQGDVKKKIFKSGRSRDQALDDLSDVQATITSIRRQRANPTLFLVYLLPGTYQVSSSLIFTNADSNTIYVAAEGTVQLTTARKITSGWTLVNKGNNIWRTTCTPCAEMVKQKRLQPVPSASPKATLVTQFELYVNGAVQTLARWPNRSHRLSIFPDGYAKNPTWIVPDNGEYEPTNMVVATPERIGTSTQAGLSTHHEMLIGGSNAGDQFVDGVQRGVPRSHLLGTTGPRGFIYDPQYFTNKTYANGGKGARVHSFHDMFWGNWQWEVSRIDSTTHTVEFGWGGMQQNQGRNAANNYFLENVMEELDGENEWFYDEKTQYLYYKPNGTVSLNSKNTNIWISGDENIISITGTSRYPVTNLHFIGITFQHTHPTYLSSYMTPSGGDWAIHPHGAIYIEGCEECSIQHSLFHNLGGNAIYISGYNRNITISYNEFVGIGESAIASVGYTNGIDGTQGQHPMGNRIEHNLAHEFGLYGKQTAFYFQAVTSHTILDGNVAFNCPRAAIVFNDGFGGGHEMKYNVLFNTVRETADHGAFNSWDRDAFVTRFRDGRPSLLPAYSSIHHNLIMSNYESVWPLDHDDGSSWYVDIYNVLIYGGAKNLFGHDFITSNNLYIHPDALDIPRTPHGFKSPVCAASAFAKTGDSGYGIIWTNNTCILRKSVAYAFTSCNKYNPYDPPNPITGDNTFYSPIGDVYVGCGEPFWPNGTVNTASFIPMNLWQMYLGQDFGSTVQFSQILTADSIIAQAKAILPVP